MQHRFRYVCYDAAKLLEGCNKLSTFVSRVNKQAAEEHHMGWTPDEYKGFAFEAFVEVLVTSSPIDKRINIVNYRPANTKKDGPDMGIDGYGISHNGNLHTVQAKFRSDGTDILTTRDDVSNFVANTDSKLKEDPDYQHYTDVDMTVFTTAKDLHHIIKEQMYYGRVRVIGYNDLRGFVDGNEAFWSEFRRQMQEPAKAS